MLCCHAIVLCQPVGWPAKCHTKRCLKFENNVVSCTTFQWRLTCQPGFYCVYMYVSLSGFLTICPDLVLMTLFTCAGSVFFFKYVYCSFLLIISCLFMVLFYVCLFLATFGVVLCLILMRFLVVVVAHSVVYNAGLLLILFDISASGSAVLLDGVFDGAVDMHLLLL